MSPSKNIVNEIHLSCPKYRTAGLLSPDRPPTVLAVEGVSYCIHVFAGFSRFELGFVSIEHISPVPFIVNHLAAQEYENTGLINGDPA
jgi:hypothetical protein